MKTIAQGLFAIGLTAYSMLSHALPQPEPVPLPEPSTLPLLIAGLIGGLVVARWFKKK